MKYRIEVRVFGSKEWTRNGMWYESVNSAISAAVDLEYRWLLVQDWRIVDENGVEVDRRKP
jgi:hypothetical protein